MKRSRFSLSVLMLAILFSLGSACGSSTNTKITASGTLSVVEVPIAPEVSGRVVKVTVNEGDSVKPAMNYSNWRMIFYKLNMTRQKAQRIRQKQVWQPLRPNWCMSRVNMI